MNAGVIKQISPCAAACLDFSGAHQKQRCGPLPVGACSADWPIYPSALQFLSLHRPCLAAFVPALSPRYHFDLLHLFYIYDFHLSDGRCKLDTLLFLSINLQAHHCMRS
jgi:hypothetical protein